MIVIMCICLLEFQMPLCTQILLVPNTTDHSYFSQSQNTQAQNNIYLLKASENEEGHFLTNLHRL